MGYHKMQYSKAYFSKNRLYRYFLERCWDMKKPALMVIGLNPSTADHVQDDQTVRKCKKFAKSWGYGRLYMMNLFAYRATEPTTMKAFKKPIGQKNNLWLRRIAKRSGLILGAWGNHGFHLDRDLQVLELLKKYKIHCLEKNCTGCPKHPLYCKDSLKPQVYKFI